MSPQRWIFVLIALTSICACGAFFALQGANSPAGIVFVVVVCLAVFGFAFPEDF